LTSFERFICERENLVSDVNLFRLGLEALAIELELVGLVLVLDLNIQRNIVAN